MKRRMTGLTILHLQHCAEDVEYRVIRLLVSQCGRCTKVEVVP